MWNIGTGILMCCKCTVFWLKLKVFLEKNSFSVISFSPRITSNFSPWLVAAVKSEDLWLPLKSSHPTLPAWARPRASAGSSERYCSWFGFVSSRKRGKSTWQCALLAQLVARCIQICVWATNITNIIFFFFCKHCLGQSL